MGARDMAPPELAPGKGEVRSGVGLPEAGGVPTEDHRLKAQEAGNAVHRLGEGSAAGGWAGLGTGGLRAGRAALRGALRACRWNRLEDVMGRYLSWAAPAWGHWNFFGNTLFPGGIV